MKSRLKLSLTAVMLPCLLAPAFAQDAKPAAGRDPNERVCEKITVVGSRLSSKRYCATRAEWEDKKRQDREGIDRMQRLPCLPGAQAC